VSLAKIPSGSKKPGCRQMSSDDVAHALLTESSATPGRSDGEIRSKSALGTLTPPSGQREPKTKSRISRLPVRKSRVHFTFLALFHLWKSFND
jgi:hypothetical protein